MGGEKMIEEVITKIPWSEMHWFIAVMILLTIVYKRVGIVIGSKILTFKVEDIEKEKGSQKSDPKNIN